MASGSPAPGRRPLLQALAGAALWAGGVPLAARERPGGASCRARPWPLWEAFLARFVQADGRVVDDSVPEQHSTSEGQSYAMFFALVANDRPRFDLLWRWSVANLAGGDIGARLPAWRWGRQPDGRWGVLDANSASDADLWFAYALLEAARLWQAPAYEAPARDLLRRIAGEEVASLPGLGPALLPGRHGFAAADQWRLNPSYSPLPVLRRLAGLDPAGPWAALADSAVRLLAQTTPRGLAPDWVAYRATGERSGAFAPDPEHGDRGSYDAIRTYLWAGMTHPADPAAAGVLRRLDGMARLLARDGVVPEEVRTTSGAARGRGPVGFSAALLPWLRTAGRHDLAASQQQRLRAELLETAAPKTPPYYDQVLGLFGSGWLEQRYRFLPSGRLQPHWENACRPASAPSPSAS